MRIIYTRIFFFSPKLHRLNSCKRCRATFVTEKQRTKIKEKIGNEFYLVCIVIYYSIDSNLRLEMIFLIPFVI